MKSKKKTKLAKYIEEECIVQNAFAKKIGISGPTLLLLIRGQRLPSLEVAFNIEKATHGKVKMTDWLDELETGKKAKL